MNGRNKLVVGRAEWKLAEAVREFGFDFRGNWVVNGGIYGAGAENGGAEGDCGGEGDGADEGAAEV